MFTGIVQGTGKVHRIHEGNGLHSLEINMGSDLSKNVQIGASVAINGTCLTVTQQYHDTLSFDVIEQTLILTNLGKLVEGDLVNVERSLKMGDELGGHMLSGHVTQAIEILVIDHYGDNTRIWFATPSNHQKHILPQGFIGLNGCSLTIAEVEDQRFCVCLIPETLNTTTYGSVQVGDFINMEIDHQTQTIVASVERILTRQ